MSRLVILSCFIICISLVLSLMWPPQFPVHKNQFYQIDHVDMIRYYCWAYIEKKRINRKSNLNKQKFVNKIINDSHLHRHIYLKIYTCNIWLFRCRNNCANIIYGYQRSQWSNNVIKMLLCVEERPKDRERKCK